MHSQEGRASTSTLDEANLGHRCFLPDRTRPLNRASADGATRPTVGPNDHDDVDSSWLQGSHTGKADIEANGDAIRGRSERAECANVSDASATAVDKGDDIQVEMSRFGRSNATMTHAEHAASDQPSSPHCKFIARSRTWNYFTTQHRHSRH